jgi:hypothetical protein
MINQDYILKEKNDAGEWIGITNDNFRICGWESSTSLEER